MSNFSQKVYELCKKIPKGKVTTYKIIADALGTKGYRAVGMALNKNPHAPIVPCHRVVGSNGKLTGFAQGLDKKAALLKSEGIKVRNNKVLNLETVTYRP